MFMRLIYQGLSLRITIFLIGAISLASSLSVSVWMSKDENLKEASQSPCYDPPQDQLGKRPSSRTMSELGQWG